MIRYLIIQHGILMVAVLALTFMFIKFLGMWLFGLKDDMVRLFTLSFGFISKAVISNTDHEGLNSYYKYSNNVNRLFYFVTIVIVILYIVFKFYFVSLR